MQDEAQPQQDEDKEKHSTGREADPSIQHVWRSVL
jgi:hypothetical protein